MSEIYKLLDQAAWQRAQAEGTFRGSAADLRDGYIHFSDAAQVADTARLHFRGVSDLVLLALESEALGAALKWEPSRGGALFPHLYGALPLAAVRWTRNIALDDDGVPVIGALAP